MIREAGDSALLLELEPVIAPAVNARAIAIADAVRARGFLGVRDVVPAFRSVAVFFDPLATDVAALAAAMHEAESRARQAAPLPSAHFRRIEIPVVYGGEHGPDLDAVAAHAGCTPQEVVERHSTQTYRVYMLGFLPGFPYMGSVDETIATPRRATPRVRVPAGSVGIAGRQTGIYPQDSPGGWQIIGRTSVEIFNAESSPPAMFAPGDEVKFVSIDGGANPAGFANASLARLASRQPSTSARFVTVVSPGLFTTVQDSGRWGHQHVGVPVSGAMDPVAHRLANALVGNPRDAAALEATLAGPELRIEQDTTVAVAGADLQASVDGAPVPVETSVHCRAGAVLRFGGRRSGARATLAFDGGVTVPPVLGSRATHLLSGLGGIDGRALRAGDRIPLGPRAGLLVRRSLGEGGKVGPAGARVRVMPGPQAHLFDHDALGTLQRTRFTVLPQSDRMGYRLTSDRPFARAGRGEMISDIAFTGAVQVPPSGDPILLMADRQTTGGYPQLAVVITADLPVAAQLAPGDWIEFDMCTRADAIRALVAQEGKLLAVR